ncbi:glycerophosphodiester phosphodiesterase family protein [Acidocella sp.]|uniref:glycerophosphodiester phosphodiesterase family protein n=1 Tax=Acidocella sp. TaxID=50710 RepID=UPI0017CF8999|nr:glycerophosphodiester phosphodiesterase family protein [Acidocella sp.]NNM57666.1 glycerophosphodiester phosphodiesterase [Acidocella sp.]
MRAKLYGHRGARGERPENTLEGFAYARALGLAGIETDIAMTADFVPVLHHDAALACGGLIKDLNAADLPGFIPTLAQALRAVPGVEWLLEVKTFPDQPGLSHTPALMVEKILPVLEGLPLERVRILAFDWTVLRAVAARAPDLPRVCLTAPGTAAARELWWGNGFSGMTLPHAVAASGAWGWAGLHEAMEASQIAEARALNLQLFAWTVNTGQDFHRLSPLVDGIITDYPSRFV